MSTSRIRVRDVLEWCTAHGFVLGCFVLPLGLGVAYENGTLGSAEIFEPRDRTAVYMASMSMTPMPDPSAEVIEVTDELVNQPKPRPEPEDPGGEGTDAPLPQERDPEAKTPAPETSDTPAKKTAPREEAVADSLRAGGKVEGPTQDGEGSHAQKCLPDNPAIVSKGNDTWHVQTDLVDYYVDHLREAEKLARTQWFRGSQGNVMGFRVSRVRCGNDLYQLGFRGGDVVRKVNGEDVTSIPQAIKAYRKLRKKKKLVVQLKRNKKERTFTYILK